MNEYFSFLLLLVFEFVIIVFIKGLLMAYIYGSIVTRMEEGGFEP